MLLVLLLCTLLPFAYAKQAGGQDVMAYGKTDGKAPGWAIMTDLPKGWTEDCCKYAAAIGVNLVLYQGEWSGKPEGVMVLNVWPAKLPTLAAELQDDRQHYLQSDAHGKASVFALQDPHGIACQGVLFQGSDKVDDVVVFCDPGKPSGIRYSWSMTVAANDPNRQALIDTFKQVVQRSSYMTYEKGSTPMHANAKP
ncbi:hypothetical protein [Dyella choica]|uniref:DUF3304 domain-containing protein n=1 Tax=Dyella choica TaxID=1927959 RepID=A0A3S0WV90_9GAMM|nr:hypothetical protein [Dyella choica]RUL74481.1 hypothetical protein EKH80_13430 [Dyella choica]